MFNIEMACEVGVVRQLTSAYGRKEATFFVDYVPLLMLVRPNYYLVCPGSWIGFQNVSQYVIRSIRTTCYSSRMRRRWYCTLFSTMYRPPIRIIATSSAMFPDLSRVNSCEYIVLTRTQEKANDRFGARRAWRCDRSRNPTRC